MPKENKLEFRGDLEETPLPEILQRIRHYRVPGVVQCARGARLSQIFLDDGEIIFALSNNRRESLGDMLLAEGKISQAQYDESVVRLKATGKRQGVVLVDMGILSPKELYAAVIRQVTKIVWKIFNWSEGEVSFAPGAYRRDELIKLNIATRLAILRGILKVRDPRRLVSRLGSATQVFTPTYTTEQLTDLKLSSEEMNLLELVTPRRCLRDLTREGSFDAAMNARFLYAFFVLGLIEPHRAIKVQKATEGGKMSVAP